MSLWIMYDKHIWLLQSCYKFLNITDWISQCLKFESALFFKYHWTMLIMIRLGYFYQLYSRSLQKKIIVSYFYSNSALESFRLKFKVNSKDNEPLCNVLCKYKECIRIYYLYTSDCSNRDGFARNTSSSYHTCKHHQSTLNQMNIHLIYHKNKKSICRHHFRLCLRCLQYHSLLYQACLNALGFYFYWVSAVFSPQSFVAYRVSF